MCLDREHAFSTNSINVIYRSSNSKFHFIFYTSPCRWTMYQYAFKSVFRRKKKREIRLFRDIVYKGGGKRNSFRSRGNWPREGIYLPFLFQPFTNNKKWSKVYRKVDYFIYPTGGRLLFQLRDENWFPYTQDLPHKVYLPTPLPSALRFTCCSPVTNKVCCIKGITWLLFNAAPSFESPCIK